ncbi:very-long-chain 3-oxoacyl-CoA reductase 1-like [Quillaja saponaria]|uniref:Very-long-chain 3-oxoacyl-CoA reductase 1-like n=1 Tax=Quillaja saponaria TaxID=32244 RepID=A0AAD7LGH2_QUISA|nr:very-long-chain 3-oxoacyl-CoA reductase 1-like [Quillaja saponaria]
MAIMEYWQHLFFTASIILGFISFCKSFIYFLKWLWVMFLRPPKNLKEYGSWTIITGSTDGIGKAIAFELASKGLNLILVGRNSVKLESTSMEIRERHHVKIKHIVIDFAKLSTEETRKRIEGGIAGLDVGILINNAGMGYPARFLHESDLEVIDSVLKVNLMGATWVTKAVLPGMIKKKKGAIINIGSGSSVVAPSYPLGTIYSATKAYLAMFTKSINLEYKTQGIDIQCQIPLYVSTKMVKLKPSVFIPTAEIFGKASVRWIGYGEQLCLPYWLHGVQWFLLQPIPDALMNWYILRFFMEGRRRSLVKQQTLINLHNCLND